ncbi:ABC transporter permease [Bifidobacterium subtile]|nr:ABC transporter permease [Bifidobacterium subtile]
MPKGGSYDRALRLPQGKWATRRLRKATAMTVLKSIWAHAQGRYALIVLSAWVLIALASLLWTPHSLWATDGYHVWAAPSTDHWLGTDGTGADVFSWLMAGSRTNLLIVVLTIGVSAVIGLLLIAAMVSGAAMLSGVTVVAVDALISIPTVLIALILAVPMGASIAVIVIACGLGYGLNLARVARPQALLAARSDYAEAARAAGVSPLRVLVSHIVPNALPTMSVQLSLSAGTAVLAESGLTYLGIGVPSGVPSWGHSLATSVKFINVYPITVLWPGLIVTCVVVALNLFGDALREAADPVANPALRQVRVRRAEASHAQPGLTEPEPIGLKQAEIRQTEPGQSRLEQEEPSQVKSRQTRLPQPEPMQSKQVRS